jgi:hypothetical protein
VEAGGDAKSTVRSESAVMTEQLTWPRMSFREYACDWTNCIILSRAFLIRSVAPAP